MRIAKAIWLLLILLLLTAISGFAYLFITNHTSVIDLAVEQLHRPDLRQVLEQRYFTASDFTRLQRMGYSFIPILFGLLGFVIVLRKKVIRFLSDVVSVLQKLIQGVRESIRTSSKQTKIILAVILLVVLGRSIYYALHYYPQYDECWNYNYFLSNSPFNTLFAYNNYPLHNLLTFSFLTFLPDNTFTMRLPNIILGLVNILFVFALVKKIFRKEEIALAAAGLFAVLPTIVFYMMFARGVMLALFFAIPLLYFLLVRKLENCSKAELTLVVLLAALGTFSMISFCFFLLLYFLLAIIFALQTKNKHVLLPIIFTGLVCLVCIAILYLPMMLGTGMNLATSSGYSLDSINWNTFISKAEFVSRNQIGFYYGSYIFLALNVLLIFFSKRRRIIILNISLLVIPFIFPLLFKMYLPARGIGFQVFAYLFSLLLVLEILLLKTNRIIFAVTAIGLMTGFNLVSVTHTFFTWSARQDKGAYELAQVFQKNNIDSYYDQSGEFQYFVPSILYHHKIKGANIRFSSSDKRSSRHLVQESYTGNTFVTTANNFVSGNNKKIIYEYHDEDRDFVVYQIINVP